MTLTWKASTTAGVDLKAIGARSAGWADTFQRHDNGAADRIAAFCVGDGFDGGLELVQFDHRIHVVEGGLQRDISGDWL